MIIAECRRMTSMITPANRNTAVIIVNWRRDHEVVIIAPSFSNVTCTERVTTSNGLTKYLTGLSGLTGAIVDITGR